jgi:hypothetical protein
MSAQVKVMTSWRNLMSGGIYLIRDGQELLEMSEQPYEFEDMLQTFSRDPVSGRPNGQRITQAMLLVSREVAVSAEDSGGARWAIDHLFLDQDAIPTLIEVKRSRDTRIR